MFVSFSSPPLQLVFSDLVECLTMALSTSLPFASPDNKTSSTTGHTRDASTSNDPQSGGNSPQSGKVPTSSKPASDKAEDLSAKPDNEEASKEKK